MSEEKEKVFDLSNAEDVKQLQSSISEPTIVSYKKDSSGEMSFGVALPQRHPPAPSYLEDVKDYSDVSHDIYKQIELCRKLYVYEGIVGTVIDMFVDLSFADIKVEGLNKNVKAKKLINHFINNANKDNPNISTGIKALMRNIALEFYQCGNVFLYSKWSNAVVNDLNGKYKLPTEILTLDPTIIEIPKESVQFGGKSIQISQERVFGKKLLSQKQRAEVTKHMPTKIRNQLNKRGNQELDPYFIYHIKRKGPMYSAWGIPYLTRAFSAIASKRRLRALDDSTIDGMINSITIFKIGDRELPETWTQSRLVALSRLLRNPAASLMLVWTWDIEVLHVGPKGEVLDFSNRYSDANNDILYALGVPIALLTGQGERAGDVWASILFFMERLEEERQHVKCWLEDTIQKILYQNNFKDLEPKVRLIKPKVNKDEIRNIVLGYYDRGIISKETAAEEAGYDLPDEHEKRINEEKTGINEDMQPPYSPYGQNNQNPETTTKNTDKKKDNQKKDSKTLEVDRKNKNSVERIKGSISGSPRDRIESMFSLAITEDIKIDEIKDTLLSLGNDIFEFDSSIAKKSMGMDKKEYNTMINFITKNIKSKTDVFSNLNNFFMTRE